MKPNPKLREIPSVDRVLRELGEVGLPRALVVAIVRDEMAKMRAEARKSSKRPSGGIERFRSAIDNLARERIQPVINGTGIIVHTNLGRSPLAQAAIKSLVEIGSNYSNLEFDLNESARGTRGEYVERALAVLCGAEAATVVNNCAAALVLILHHFTRDSDRREVIVSRGELVQIGGGFRIPEILETSGAVVREVGTTNKTTVSDYARAIGKRTAMILKVHRSNFFMDGFVASPQIDELAAIARKHRVLLVEDLGSGPEKRTRGADLITFSGDKLLGGPQAGIIAGRAKHVVALKRNPLFRALRCDKLVLASLQETVDLHLSGREGELPINAMLHASVDSLRERGSKLIEQLRDLPLEPDLAKCNSQVGGGARPRESIPSIALELSPKFVEEFASNLRAGSPPVIGTIARGKLQLDLRTVFSHRDDTLAQAIRAACK